MKLRTAARDVLIKYPLLDGLFRRFIWSRIHFPEVEMRFLNSLGPHTIDIAIDVGAAMGSYAWILNRKSRQVFCFEPGDVHSSYLERVVFGSRIRVVRAAVGDFCARVRMFTPGADSDALHSATLSQGNPVIQHDQTRVREVDQVTLDAFFAEKIGTGRAVDVIKVDVEGYELEVFKGAQSLLSRYHPLVFCEIEKRHNAAYRDIFSLLRDAGYQSYVFRDGRFNVFVDDTLDDLQSAEALKFRIGGDYDPRKNWYVNNFVFQHELTRIKVSG